MSTAPVLYTKLKQMRGSSRAYSRTDNAEESCEWSEEEGSFVSSADSDHENSWSVKLFDWGDKSNDSKKNLMMVSKCTKCGTVFKDTSAFCSNCGHKRDIESSPIEALRKELEVSQHQQGECKRRLQEATNAWHLKETQLQNMLNVQVDEEKRIVEAIEHFSPPVHEGPRPPGPRSLRCVEQSCFTCVSSTVIVFNVLLLIYQACHPEMLESLKWMNYFFLMFYTIELVLKMILWQSTFFCGPIDFVAWHVLDTVIVGAGLLDLVILPLFAAGGQMHMLSALRGLRLLRLLKLFHNFFVTDTSWAEGETFQIFIMSLIALSSLLMGLECDWPQLTTFLASIYWENVVLAIFVFEVAVRLKNSGLKFFCDKHDVVWNWLDFTVVVGGMLDQWMLPLSALTMAMITGKPATYSTHMGQFMVLLRMARLLRILRLVRLIKQVPQLFNLLSGIAQAMAGMVWVLMLTIVVLYFFALLSVKLFRDGLVYDGSAPPDVQELFDSVPDTIFVLFTVMDGHKSILDPLLNSLPATKVVFMMFVMISEWAMLSILTAVVSENMIAVTEARKGEAEAAELIDKENEKTDQLLEIFHTMDLNQDGAINLVEFDTMLKDEERRSALCEASNLSVVDLRLMFNILERNGFVSRKEFIEACRYESKAVSERSLMKLEKRLQTVEEKISTTVVIVEGAGMEICNGTYMESGVHNLKPMYKKMDKSGCTIYFDFFWKINDSADTTMWRYHMECSEEPNMQGLHQGTWQANETVSGSLPRVKWESHHILDKRIEYLEGMILETHRDVRMLTSRLLGGRSP